VSPNWNTVKMKETRLDILLHKQLTGQISQEETLTLEQILADNDAQKEANETSAIWEASAQYSPSLSFNTESNFSKLLSRIADESADQITDTETVPQVQTRPEARVFNLFSSRNLSRVAAVLVFGVLSFMGYQQFSSNTISGGMDGQYVSLEDGSSLWISPESTVTYKSSFANNRTVELVGKAFFDVKRDESKPFTINANDIDVTVLGTSFTVDTDKNEVAVSSGKVKVAKDKENITITKDQKVSVQDGNLTLSSVSDSDFNWIIPVLKFDNAPLDQVIKELSLFYKVELKYKGRRDLSKCPFTATNLEDASLDQVISILTATYDMQVEKSEDGNLITFSKIRCR